MKFSPYVIDLLKRKSKKDFRLSGDCEYLALDIESVTGEHIGVNTLKRLLGFIDDEREPRPSTLDIIARYLDFENWDLLKCFDDKSNSHPLVLQRMKSEWAIFPMANIFRSPICQIA